MGVIMPIPESPGPVAELEAQVARLDVHPVGRHENRLEADALVAIVSWFGLLGTRANSTNGPQVGLAEAVLLAFQDHVVWIDVEGDFGDLVVFGILARKSRNSRYHGRPDKPICCSKGKLRRPALSLRELAVDYLLGVNKKSASKMSKKRPLLTFVAIPIYARISHRTGKRATMSRIKKGVASLPVQGNCSLFSTQATSDTLTSTLLLKSPILVANLCSRGRWIPCGGMGMPEEGERCDVEDHNRGHTLIRWRVATGPPEPVTFPESNPRERRWPVGLQW
jgi:hypothetical protein